MDSEKLNRRQSETRRTQGLLRQLFKNFRAHLDEQLKSENVTTAQLRFLKEVMYRPGATGAQLARACEITPQSSQAMMNRAVERGWLVRGKDPENGRLVTVRLTRSGEELLAHAQGIMTDFEAVVWAGIDLDQLKAMNAVLERGLANLEP